MNSKRKHFHDRPAHHGKGDGPSGKPPKTTGSAPDFMRAPAICPRCRKLEAEIDRLTSEVIGLRSDLGQTRYRDALTASLAEKVTKDRNRYLAALEDLRVVALHEQRTRCPGVKPELVIWAVDSAINPLEKGAQP